MSSDKSYDLSHDKNDKYINDKHINDKHINDKHIQKYLDKLVKLQQDQNGSRQQEYELLRTHLSQMNVLLDQLINVTGSGSTVAATKKYVPFQTGSQVVGQELTPPSNPDAYPTSINVYKINDNRTVPHMTLINDGPGDIFFISAYGNDQFNTKEEHLNVNDQRELFNVYELRLRSTLPTTSIRLIEGIFRTGSTAPQTKINVEIRPTVQTNEVLKTFGVTLDNFVPTITITAPTVQTLPADYSIAFVQPPLHPGQTIAFLDESTGTPMPFTIPTGSVFESFSIFANTSTDGTARNYFELVPGSNVWSLSTTFPFSARGIIINGQFNISEFSSQAIDPLGAPAPGRRVLITLTNDDPFTDMIGDVDLRVVIRRLV